MNCEENLKVLLVDDESHQRNILSEFLGMAGHQVETATNGKEAYERLKQSGGAFDAVVTDLSMPEMNGIELIREAKKLWPDLGFIIITANGTIETAIEAIKAGAYDYVQKPVELDDLSLRLSQLAKLRQLEAKAEYLAKENRKLRGSSEVVAESSCMKELMAELEKVSGSSASVLLLGETGVGKEVVSRWIHEHSPRAKGPFVAVNCSAIAENLIESEFFGHEKGAFTGADKKTDGLFQKAHGGTLFLDEIGEMTLFLQPKILRVIEDLKVRRVGGTQDQKIDIRLIAATHRNLKQHVVEGKFREDLYFRLNVLPILIPSLRERKEDIEPLVKHFIRRHIKSLNVQVRHIDEKYISTLKEHSFPGNVRELGNIVERSMIYMSDGYLKVENLPKEIISGATNEAESPRSFPTSKNQSLNEALASFEREFLVTQLEAYQKDIDALAKALKVSRSTLYSKLAKHKIKDLNQ